MNRTIRMITSAMALALAPLALAADQPAATPMHAAKESPGESSLIVDGAPASQMMTRFLLAEAKHLLKQCPNKPPGDAEHLPNWQGGRRKAIVEALGGLPKSGTPLNARVTGTEEFADCRLERVLFESQPHFYVTAVLFLPNPKNFPPPWPAVLVPCGHADKAAAPYPNACLLLAQHGIAAMIFEPIDQGERSQWRELNARGNPVLGYMNAHMALGVGSIFLGINTATFMVHDAMRCLDYLQSRPDIDGRRLGMMGNSGGGTQTAYVSALDDRIVASAPSCYITGFDFLLPAGVLGDSEQNIHAQLQLGINHWTYLAMRAPRPTQVGDATKDFFPIAGARDSVEKARQVYQQFHAGDHVAMVETEGPHGWHPPLQEASVKWMLRWLADKKDVEVVEPENMAIPTPKQMQVTETGQVLDLPGARSVYDLNQDRASALALQRAALWKQGESTALEQVRLCVGVRPLKEIAHATVQMEEIERENYTIQKFLIRPEPGIVLPALEFLPKTKAKSVVLWLDEQGMSAAGVGGGEIERLVQQGNVVVAVDLRGIGETLSAPGLQYDKRFGQDAKNITIAYLLGRSYVGMRTEDVLASAQAALALNPGAKSLRLVAKGAKVSVPALHAAALEKNLFESVDLTGEPESFEWIVKNPLSNDQYVHAVHGALAVYDLPELRRSLGDRLVEH